MKCSTSMPAVGLSCLLLGSIIVLPATAAPALPAKAVTSHITPYAARFGRTRPVIVIVGENSGTEVTDFLIPYGVLKQSNAADVFAVSTQTGPLTLRPALTIEPDATVTVFDQRFPDGADYVIVPAVNKIADPTLTAWISTQAAKGATIVSICDGALVVANTGLMNGHRQRRTGRPKPIAANTIRRCSGREMFAMSWTARSFPAPASAPRCRSHWPWSRL